MSESVSESEGLRKRVTKSKDGELVEATRLQEESKPAAVPGAAGEDKKLLIDLFKRLLLMGVILYMYGWVVVWYAKDEHVISTPREQVPVRMQPSFMEAGSFSSLQQCAEDLLGVDPDYAAAARRLRPKMMSAEFTADGLPDLLRDDQLHCFAEFLNAARLPEANAFNMTISAKFSQEPADAKSLKTYRPNLRVIDAAHLGKLKGVVPYKTLWEKVGRSKSIIAHQTDIFFPIVSQGVYGGATRVYLYSRKTPKDTADAEKLLQPANNTLYSVRGDAYTSSVSFLSPEKTARIATIVFHQFVLTDEQLALTESFKKSKLIRR